MKKSQMIILILAGIISFVGSFGTTFLFKGSQPTAAKAVAESSKNYSNTSPDNTPAMDPSHARIVASSGQNLSKSMTEKQLHSLIYDIREKMKGLQRREKELAYQEKRIETARDTLQQDIDSLDNLRVQLTTTLAGLKSQEDNLRKTMVEITDIEKANMQRIASAYEKMDVTQASKIMINMAAGNQLGDAVKILYYMGDRNSGNWT